MEGLIGLTKSKKGVSFGSTVAVILGMASQGVVPAVLAAKLVAGLAGLHLVSQGIADFKKVPDAK